MKKKSAKKATERLRRTHDVIFQRVNAFASAARLNLHKTARLGNRFKWALKDAGYLDEFAGTLTTRWR